jgi:uncharacterized protein (DUF433 family)
MFRRREHPWQAEWRLGFKNARMPVSTVFENFESGATIEEIMEWFGVTREQVVTVLEFAARSLDAPIEDRSLTPVDAHSV